MIFTPMVDGAVAIRTPPQAFFRAFQRRVDAGLLTGRPHPRSRYVVTQTSSDRLEARALDWMTAINVGLNEIDLNAPGNGMVHYRVRYWRWAKFVLALCGVFGVILGAIFAAIDLRAYIARNPGSMIPGLSIGQNMALVWCMVALWGFAWPWALIALHKRPLRGIVERLIAEVDASGGPAPC